MNCSSAWYEKKKYIAKEYVPEKPPEFPEGWYELIEAEKQKKDIRKIVLPSHNASTKPAIATTAAPSAKPKSSDDLFGLAVGHGGGGGDADLLGISGSSA